MFGDSDHEMEGRLADLEREVPVLRREAAELRAAYTEALDLALHAAVPNVVAAVVDEA